MRACCRDRLLCSTNTSLVSARPIVLEPLVQREYGLVFSTLMKHQPWHESASSRCGGSPAYQTRWPPRPPRCVFARNGSSVCSRHADLAQRQDCRRPPPHHGRGAAQAAASPRTLAGPARSRRRLRRHRPPRRPHQVHGGPRRARGFPDPRPARVSCARCPTRLGHVPTRRVAAATSGLATATSCGKRLDCSNARCPSAARPDLQAGGPPPAPIRQVRDIKPVA